MPSVQQISSTACCFRLFTLMANLTLLGVEFLGAAPFTRTSGLRLR
jgi:hypothetical protein